MHHEIRVRDDMPKIDYCVLTVAGNPTMSGGGARKTQQPLASFFIPTTGPAPVSHRPFLVELARSSEESVGNTWETT
jgi:hypothetical protein